MHLIEICHGAVAFCKIANMRNGGHIPIHRIDALKSDQLRAMRAGSEQELLEVCHVVVAEDALVAAGLPNAIDHGRMIELVRENDTVGKQHAIEGWVAEFEM